MIRLAGHFSAWSLCFLSARPERAIPSGNSTKKVQPVQIGWIF